MLARAAATSSHGARNEWQNPKGIYMNSNNAIFEIGKNRIEALSDGIFAIVMTLLILEIHVPNLPHNSPNVEVVPALIALWPKFVSYIVTFVSLGFFWVGHHTMYHAIRRADRNLLWLNILFFMFVSLLPFSTSVLNAFPQAFVAPFFFGANIAVIGWILFLQWIYVSSQPDMLAHFVTARYRATVKSRMLMIPLATTLTVIICFWSVGISLAIYILLLPLYMLPGNVDTATAGVGRHSKNQDAGNANSSLLPRRGADHPELSVAPSTSTQESRR